MEPAAAAPAPRRRLPAQLVAVAAVVQLLAAVFATTLVTAPAAAPAATVVARARVAPEVMSSADAAEAQRDARTAAVQRLLAARSRAVLQRDRAGFLATVDPRATALRTRQASVFDALQQVPIGTWTYTLDPSVERPPDAALDARYGAGTWWAPNVTFGYTLAGFDERPTTSEQHLTFVRRGGSWLLGADDDFAAVGLATTPALWDDGPVVAVRSDGVLALGHPASLPLLRDVAARVAAAVPAVTAVWGPGWSKRAVVIVPSTTAELSSLLGGSVTLGQIAAVATAELDRRDYRPTGDRILINPENFAKIGPLGRRVVLTHELTHVASRAATGPEMPTWLAEGLADYVGYGGVGVPLSVSARELQADVRAGRAPTALPTNADFDGANLNLSQAYEGAWLAVRLIARQHGQDGMLAFYRAVGKARDGSSDDAVDAAFASQLGTTTAAFSAAWRADLQRQLG